MTRPRRRALGLRAAAIASVALLSTVASIVAPGTAGAARTARARSGGRRGTPSIIVGTRPLGRISPDLFGANLLWPYASGGAFDTARDRFYPAFVAMVRRLEVSAIRYPGGTTADSFHWERAVGTPSRRRENEPYGLQARRFSPGTVLDGPVSSVVGPGEFGRLLERTGAVGDVVVNFATGSVDEAAGLVGYLTARPGRHPSTDPADPSYWAERRAREGHRHPYDVRYFEVGNEQDARAEYGWRSGTLVALGVRAASCPPGAIATCLYAFGGTTRFVDQRVGTYADELPFASVSSGEPDQHRFVYYPPVVAASETVRVGGVMWRPVRTLSVMGPEAHAYTFESAAGEIRFGDGVHGAIPPAGAAITASYDSGPHAGFVGFYRAMKAVDPRAQICESEEANGTILRLLGRRYRYDCVVLHEYAAPRNVRAPLGLYEQDLMADPLREGRAVAAVERAARRYSGRRVPVVVTEYGQAVLPMPVGDPSFDLSLDEAVLAAGQLREWIDRGVPLADKYLLSSAPLFADGRAGLVTARSGLPDDSDNSEQAFGFEPGRRIDSAMIANAGGRVVVEPSGLVLGLMHELAGARRLEVGLRGGPRMGPLATPVLEAVAARASRSRLDLVVINASPARSVRARIVFRGGARRRVRLTASVLDGPSPVAFNTAVHPRAVAITTRSLRRRAGRVFWDFPAHSVTLLAIRPAYSRR